MLKTVLSFLLLSLLITSCASKSDHEKLQSQLMQHKRLVDSYQRRSGDQIKQFEKNATLELKQSRQEMASFKQAYNPELHADLKKNVEEAKAYYKMTLETLESIKKQENQIRQLVALAKKHTDITIKNAKASSTQNVINEFKALKENWKKQSKNFESTSAASKKSAEEALKLAIKSEKEASTASLESKKVIALKATIKDLEHKIKLLKSELETSHKLSKAKQKNIDLLFDLYKSLNTRVDSLIKK